MTIDADQLRSGSPLLGSLTRSELEAVLAVAVPLHRPRGRRVLHEGEDAAVLLLDGIAVTRATSSTGAEYLRRLHGPGEALGLSVALGQVGDPAEVLAHHHVDGLRLPGTALRRLVNEEPGLSRACIRALVSDLAQARQEEALLADTCTTDRVILRIIELAERWGRQERHGLHLDVGLTQEELASWARTSRESTAKVLHQLREGGLIVTGRRELIVLDLPGLRERASHPPHDPTIRELLQAIG